MTVRVFIERLMLAAAMLAALAGPATAAGSAQFHHAAFIKVGGATSIPVGHAEFCANRPRECAPHANGTTEVELTEQRWAELLTVNAHYNHAITPMSDMDLYGVEEFWTYPSRGYGDCEDFALAKRRALIEAGWPASTLLMTVVRQANGEGHAVLTVRTDRGDLVLDNQVGLIHLWNETGYQFLKRQSQAHAGQWVDLLDDRPILVAAR